MLSAASVLLHAQDSTPNYILGRRLLHPDGHSYVEDVTYYDGLGRRSHTLSKSVQDGLVRERLFSLFAYDAAGRPVSGWLPVPVTSDYTSTASFTALAKGTASGYGDTHPYRQVQYEASPLGRPLLELGEGARWHESSRGVASGYLCNENQAGSVLSCKKYGVSGTSLTGGNTYYAASTLHVHQTTDADGHCSYTFTDADGKVLLVRRVAGTALHDTYFVYDDLGQLCFVLQPMYQSDPSVYRYAYRYEYDQRGRCVQKTLPGQSSEVFVYNDANQLTYSQDGVQRASGQWTYYKYDGYGRLSEQGECLNRNHSDHPSFRVRNYYDTYSFVGTVGYPVSVYPSGNSNGRGYLTGQELSVEGAVGTICRAFYYDIRGREVQRVSGNLLGGYDTVVSSYTFSNRPLTTTHTHTASGQSRLEESYTYRYDASDRLVGAAHTLNGNSVALYDLSYDRFGRLSGKSFHGRTSSPITYSYNLRGWLTGISGSQFSQNLYYNTGNGTACYNGNISSLTWQAGGEATPRGYKFTYDGLNRLQDAVYGEGTNIGSNANRFTEKVTGYDKNGNILSLQRYGQLSASGLPYPVRQEVSLLPA